jgi:hypothetical protein
MILGCYVDIQVEKHSALYVRSADAPEDDVQRIDPCDERMTT